jgi:glycosyltransferase involved in cell wall biosynthesis
MNKPVIVGQARMMREFVEGNRVGMSIKESDAGDLADKIRILYNTPSMRDEFIANSRKIAQKYSWEETSRPFIESYKKLTS